MSSTPPSTPDSSAAQSNRNEHKSGWIARILILLALVAIISGVLIEQRTRPILIVGPMVQIPTPGGLTIVWEMDSSIGHGVAWLEDAPGVNLVERSRNLGRRHEAAFTGLTPGRTYRYSVANDRGLFGSTVVAGPYETRVPPPRGTPFRFVAFGDSGNGSNTQAEFAKRIAAARPDVIIHVGDLVYPAGAGETYGTHFYEPNAELIRHAPFMPSLGNHDVATDKGRPLLAHFVCPENGPEGIEPERCYWFDYGDARFVALDSNLVEADGAISHEEMKSVIAPWARRVLTDCDARWKFVFYHHPFYTGSSHSAEGAAFMKEAFLDVFEETGVDVVFCGHNHLYERTAPLRSDQIVADGEGIVYIVTGAGGVSRYAEKLPPPPYMRAYNDQVFSYTQVDLSADRLELNQIDENGKVIDTYAIEKNAQRAQRSSIRSARMH